MCGMSQEKEWELRRMASKYIHEMLTETGNIEEARLLVTLVASILAKPCPMPDMTACCPPAHRLQLVENS